MTIYSEYDFLYEIGKSKYYTKFNRVPTLLESFGELLNKYANNEYKICIGFVQNFDLKFNDGNVICRIEEDGNNVKVAGRLNGSSISNDKKGYFIEIRRKYQLIKSKTHIQNSDDVKTLINIIEQFLNKFKNNSTVNNA